MNRDKTAPFKLHLRANSRFLKYFKSIEASAKQKWDGDPDNSGLIFIDPMNPEPLTIRAQIGGHELVIRFRVVQVDNSWYGEVAGYRVQKDSFRRANEILLGLAYIDSSGNVRPTPTTTTYTDVSVGDTDAEFYAWMLGCELHLALLKSDAVKPSEAPTS